MRRVQQFLVCPLAMLVALAVPAFAGQHAVDPSSIARAVAQHSARQNADRAALHEALARPEVRQTAAKLGIDLDRMASGVDTMSGADLARAAQSARQVNETLTGGASTVVISTTTIIIGLLVLLVIILAVK
jgi:hypothetical protein